MLEKVKEILAKYTQEPIEPQSMLQADLGLTSFDVVEVVMEFEDAFKIEISDRDIVGFDCVNDIVVYLKEKV